MAVPADGEGTGGIEGHGLHVPPVLDCTRNAVSLCQVGTGTDGLGGRRGVPAAGGRAGLWTPLPVCAWPRKRLGAVVLASMSLFRRSSS